MVYAKQRVILFLKTKHEATDGILIGTHSHSTACCSAQYVMQINLWWFFCMPGVDTGWFIGLKHQRRSPVSSWDTHNYTVSCGWMQKGKGFAYPESIQEVLYKQCSGWHRWWHSLAGRLKMKTYRLMKMKVTCSVHDDTLNN